MRPAPLRTPRIEEDSEALRARLQSLALSEAVRRGG